MSDVKLSEKEAQELLDQFSQIFKEELKKFSDNMSLAIENMFDGVDKLGDRISVPEMQIECQSEESFHYDNPRRNVQRFRGDQAFSLHGTIPQGINLIPNYERNGSGESKFVGWS